MLRCHGWGCKSPIDCFPHPYWMYTKCLSTLRCCGWAYGYTLMPYYMCRWGWVLGKMGYGRACMMLRCHGWGCKPPLTASHIHIGYTKCLITLRCCGWACFTYPIHGVIPSTWLWNWSQGEYDVGDIQGWRMHQGVDHGYHNLLCQAVSIKGVQKLLQGIPAAIPFQNSQGGIITDT